MYDDENNKVGRRFHAFACFSDAICFHGTKQMYNDGPYAMAIRFLEESPAKRRQPQAPVKSAVTASPTTLALGSPNVTSKPQRSPISRLLSPKPSPRPSPTVAAPPQSEHDSKPTPTRLQLNDIHQDGDGDDDSSYHSGAAGEFLDEEEVEEEAIDVNAMLRHSEVLQQSLEGNVGALSQLYTVDERKRTDVYRPRRSLLWIVLYFTLGLALPSAVAIGIMMQLGGAIVQPTLQYRLGIVDYMVPYLYITACALVTDAYILMRVALDVMCFTPLTRPSFRMIWAEPSEDEVNGERFWVESTGLPLASCRVFPLSRTSWRSLKRVRS